MVNLEQMNTLSEVALGRIPPDFVITHGTLFNVFTAEFIEGQSIWIKGNRIAYVGPDQDPSMNEKTRLMDAEGMILLPGLIEGHTHTVSNRYGIAEFIKHAIPTGVTTVVTETMELATVAGKDGIEYLVRGLEGQPIRFYYTVSPLCGLTPSEETKAPANEELLPFLRDPRCLGMGEIYWGNMFLEGKQAERVRELASMTLDLGKRVEGHGAGASGRKLQAYSNFGISSDHEPITEQEVLDRLRLGLWVMIREGSVRKELPGIRGIFEKKIDFRRLILVTDGVGPEEFLQKGYLDASLRTALEMGVPPGLVYQMVTINVAEHFRIDHLLGSLSPGKLADILIIPSAKEFSPRFIMCDGKTIFSDGKMMEEPRNLFFPEFMFHMVNVKGCSFPSLPTKGKVRAMELVSNLVTREKIIEIDDPRESKDLLMAYAVNRLGNAESFMGLLKGFGLERGAYGTTMSWDTGDMIVVGCDTQSMKTVITRLGETGGGGAFAVGNEIMAEFRAPLCGVISLEPMETIGGQIRRLEERLKQNGVKWDNPLLTIDTLGTPAVPHLRITHHGYVRLKDRKVLPLDM